MRNGDNIGQRLKDNLLNGEWSEWRVHSHIMAETIPKQENKVWLDVQKKDKWGIPLLHIAVELVEPDASM